MWKAIGQTHYVSHPKQTNQIFLLPPGQPVSNNWMLPIVSDISVSDF